MAKNILIQWLKNHKKGLIIGFIIGAFIAPFLSSLGVLFRFFEILRPILIGPMDLIGSFIPDIQTAPNTFYAPFYKWIIVLGVNGVCYALIGAIIQMALKNKS